MVKTVIALVIATALLIWLVVDNTGDYDSFWIGLLVSIAQMAFGLLIWNFFLWLFDSSPDLKRKHWWVMVTRDQTPAFFGPFKSREEATAAALDNSAVTAYRAGTNASAEIVHKSRSQFPDSHIVISYTITKKY